MIVVASDSLTIGSGRNVSTSSRKTDAALLQFDGCPFDDGFKDGSAVDLAELHGNRGRSTHVGVDSAFGRNLKRLGEIKKNHDPDNFFRLNNNIKPR